MGNITDARLRLIISGLIGVALTIVVCILWASSQAVPTELYGLVTGVWGFFSGHVYTNGTGARPNVGPQGEQGLVGPQGNQGNPG